MPSSAISKSKKYSRKRNYRKRRHSRRMQRKSRSRNAYAYNRRRRTMFGGAPEGVYKVTSNDSTPEFLDKLIEMKYAFKDTDNTYSTQKFNDDFQSDTSKDVILGDDGKKYTITVTQDGDNYKVNVKVESTQEDPGMNVTFTKVTDETEKTRIQDLPEYKQ